MRPNEFVPLVRMALAAKQAAKLPTDPDLAFCYDILNSVSRSFALVIQQLPNPLRDAICVFYLVLRGLDTVEDDMAIEIDAKLPDLIAFHEHIYKKGFHMDCGYKHYKRLMNEFGRVVDVFLSLDPMFQEVIADITRRMGEGMAEFITKEVKTVADYDLYCHYVAGLVGIGLSDLFASSGLETDEFSSMHELSNHMGLFLQKTNIIRDYLEDIMEEPAPRMFWPRAIWAEYGDTLEDFKEESNRENAVRCLNHMITDGMRHLPHSLEYMSRVRDHQVFRFCAIPQVMAIGTLALCFNNGKVFEGVVKMRRGQVAVIFTSCSTMGDLYYWFIHFLKMLQSKLDSPDMAQDDPSLVEMKKAVDDSLQLCKDELRTWQKENPSSTMLPLVLDVAAVGGAGTYAYYALNMGGSHAALPEIGHSLGIGSSGVLQTVHIVMSLILLLLVFIRLVMVQR